MAMPALQQPKPFLGRIPLAEYNALVAARYSHLKHLLVSPLHYRAAIDGDNETTPAMVRGDATHAAILEPERFAAEYVTFPGAVRRGSEWESFKRSHPGATFITASERDVALAMSKAVRSDQLAMSYLQKGQAEVAMTWTDPKTGVACKGRLDWLTDEGTDPIIVGIKTTRAAGPREFASQAAKLAYPMQWAMYRAGYNVITGRWPQVIEIAVESKEPFDVVCYEIGPEVIESGLVMYEQALGALVECTRTGVWHGQGKGQLVDLTLPPWALEQVAPDVELEFGQ